MKWLLFLSALAIGAPAAAAENPERAVAAVSRSKDYRAAITALTADRERIVREAIALTEIPAPPFKEARRAEAYRKMLADAGLEDIETDVEGNVMGVYRGVSAKGRPILAVAAHLDTVFDEKVPIQVRREGTKLHAPGIGDDSYGLAILLGYARALKAAQVRTGSDILFVGNVGEEGPGDLRGVRHLFTKGRYAGRIGSFISIDSTGAQSITYGAVGSRRLRVTFLGPGGHSYGAFGIVNPMAALGRAVVDINAIKPPSLPKTTYATSVVGGGTSVNSIPDKVWFELDMRSLAAAPLAELEARVRSIVADAVRSENDARSTRVGKVKAEITLIGDRPAGEGQREAYLTKVAAAAAGSLGYTPRLDSSSTDANIPISLNIPAITIGHGAEGGRGHSVDEWIDVAPETADRGARMGLLTILVAARR